MQYYPSSLLNLLQHYGEKGLSEPIARALMYDILRGLTELNILDFMHRDIKPENILLKPSFWNALEGINDKTSLNLYPSPFKLHRCWLRSLTPITYYFVAVTDNVPDVVEHTLHPWR